MSNESLNNISKEIFSGAPLYSIAELVESSEGMPVLNIKDIKDFNIPIQNLTLFTPKSSGDIEKYFVYPEDVIITCRGTQSKIGIMPPTIEKAIITSNLICIRPSEKILPYYLAAYLRTSAGQKSLASIAASSTMQIVLSVADIKELKIPVPPLDVQKKIVSLIESSEEFYRTALEEADTRRKITEQILMDIVNTMED